MKLFYLLFLILLSNSALALTPEKHLNDPKLEQRAVNIFKQVKCLVCQGQSIYGSNTEFSSNLREVIREKISQGFSDKEIKNHLEKEFGKQILFSSEKKSNQEIIIYILPLILLLLLSLSFFTKTKKLT